LCTSASPTGAWAKLRCTKSIVVQALRRAARGLLLQIQKAMVLLPVDPASVPWTARRAGAAELKHANKMASDTQEYVGAA
jgi:hypothetical protein